MFCLCLLEDLYRYDHGPLGSDASKVECCNLEENFNMLYHSQKVFQVSLVKLINSNIHLFILSYPYWRPLSVEDPARILSWMKVVRLAAEKISSDKTAEL